jgi:hypothetical protein
MFVAWIAFPLLLAVLCLGAGLLAEWAAGLRDPGRCIPGVLLLPLGFLTLIVFVELVTYWSWTAPLATPVVIGLPLAGYAIGWNRLRWVAPDPWPIAAALAVFGVFAAPVVLSGEATFAGYTVLGDTSVHFVLIDRLIEHGHSTAGLADSSYRDTIDAYLDTAYPFGAQGLLGAIRPLTGQDVAWIYQPYLAAIVALTSLSLYSIAGRAIESRPLRALAASIAAQPALVYSFSLQGSIKELATLAALATTVALVPLALKPEGSPRRLIPLAIASAACADVLGLAIAPWLVPLLLTCLAAMIWIGRGQRAGRSIARNVVAFAAIVAALALPVLLSANTFVSGAKDVVTASNEFGNLLGPLRKTQILGVWFEGDYRLPVVGTNAKLTHALMVLVALAAIGGVAWAIRRRAWLPVLFVGVSLFGSLLAIRRGSPWVDAKALMIGSSCVLLAAMIAVGALFQIRWRVAGALLGAALVAGVMWSNALAYRDVSLAPRDRLGELDSIGQRIDGRGPTLYNEFEEFGKHFLRQGDPTGWTETYGPPGRSGAFGTATRLGAIPIEQLDRYRTLVVRRSPLADRPPAPYRLIYSGRYYDVWTRPSKPAERVIAEYSPQSAIGPSGRASCSKLRVLSRRGPRLAYAERPKAQIVDLAGGAAAINWGTTADDPPLIAPVGPGKLSKSFAITNSGSYSVWLTGSISRPISVSIDGRRLGSVGYQLNDRAQLTNVGDVRLARGRHVVELARSGRSLHPGDRRPTLIGPVVLDPQVGPVAVRELPSERWRQLCGRKLDWVEVLQGS